ncbi:hypothetical protein ACQP1V_21110 [Microtetraspora malaysiensis]
MGEALLKELDEFLLARVMEHDPPRRPSNRESRQENQAYRGYGGWSVAQ